MYILSSVHVIKIQQYWQHDYYECGDQVNTIEFLNKSQSTILTNRNALFIQPHFESFIFPSQGFWSGEDHKPYTWEDGIHNPNCSLITLGPLHAVIFSSLEVKFCFHQIFHFDLFCIIHNKLVVVEGISGGVFHISVLTFSQRNNGSIRPGK